MSWGSPIRTLRKTTMEALNVCLLIKVVTKYHDVNNNEVQYGGRILVTVGNGQNRKQSLIIISSRDGFMLLLGLDWFDTLSSNCGPTACSSPNNQSENEVMRRLLTKYRREIFQNLQTIKGVKVKISYKPEIHSIQQKAKLVPVHRQGALLAKYTNYNKEDSERKME